MNGPSGLAFDSAGNLFVANNVANTIEKFSSTGTDLGVFADSSDGITAPITLAFDELGNLYVTNSGIHTIEKFTTGGVGSLCATTTVFGGPTYMAFTDDAGVAVWEVSGSALN